MIHDFSLDIKTLSTAKNAVILSIGAVHLNSYDEKTQDFPKFFYRSITVQDQISRGRDVEYSTVRFWLDQNPDVINETFEGPNNPNTVQTIGSAIIDLAVWLTEQIDPSEDKINVWVKGVGFDGAIIESLNKGPGKMTDTVPIEFRDWQEVRTLERLTGIKVEDHMAQNHPDVHKRYANLKHHALADAAYQGKYVYDVLGLQNA